MKHYKILLAVSLLLLLVAGCASRSAMVPAHEGNIVTYTDAKSGKVVTVSVGAPYQFKQVVDREFQGVPIYGYLYTNGDESSILVTKLPQSDFEELAEVNLGRSGSEVKAYPAKTLYISQYCELVRAYVVSFEGEVVAAVKAKGLESDNAGCGDWLTLQDVMADDLALVEAFDQSADEALSIKWN